MGGPVHNDPGRVNARPSAPRAITIFPPAPGQSTAAACRRRCQPGRLRPSGRLENGPDRCSTNPMRCRPRCGPLEQFATGARPGRAPTEARELPCPEPCPCERVQPSSVPALAVAGTIGKGDQEVDVPQLSITPWRTSAPATSRILHWWNDLPRANCAVRQFAPRSHIRKVVPSRERMTRQNGPPASSILTGESGTLTPISAEGNSSILVRMSQALVQTNVNLTGRFPSHGMGTGSWSRTASRSTGL